MALREAEIDLRLPESQFGLPDPAAHRAPGPHRNVEAGHDGAAEVVLAEFIVQRVLVGVEAVEVIHREGGQEAGTGALDAVGLLCDGGLCGTDIGIVVAREGLDFGKRGERFEAVQVVGDGVVLAEIGEEEDGEADAGFVVCEQRLLHVALALLERELCFDYVGVRRLSSGFLFLGDIHELLRFPEAALGIVVMPLGDGHSIEILHDDGGEAAGRDFDFGARDGFGGDGHPVIGAFAGGENIAVHRAHVGIDSRSVVGDEHAGVGAIGLGVDEAVLPVGAGQERGFGLDFIFAGDARCEIGGEQLLTVGLRTVQGILKCQDERGRGSLGECATAQGQGEAQYRQFARHQSVQYRVWQMNRG